MVKNICYLAVAAVERVHLPHSSYYAARLNGGYSVVITEEEYNELLAYIGDKNILELTAVLDRLESELGVKR